jgi:N,N'-diacetyllegionaminate synthase
VKLFGKDLSKDLVIVAEVGVNHEGSTDAAVAMVKLAAEAGADAVKFQTYTPARFVAVDYPERLARVTRFRLDEAGHRRVAEEGKRCGIPVFSSAITEDVVPLLADLFPAIKIASGDIDFEPVIRAAARQGKPVLMSIGNATIDEVDRAVAWVSDETTNVPLHERLILLQCTAAYPAPIDETNAAVIPMLRERYGVPVGFSNHVIGMEACLAAVALGACVLEVHFTDRKEDRTFRDHALSMTAPELRSLVQSARLIRSAVGSPIKTVQSSERDTHWEIRKGVVAARDLVVGTTLAAADLAFARPATHVPSGQRGQLIGRQLKRALAAGALLKQDDLG